MKQAEKEGVMVMMPKPVPYAVKRALNLTVLGVVRQPVGNNKFANYFRRMK